MIIITTVKSNPSPLEGNHASSGIVCNLSYTIYLIYIYIYIYICVCVLYVLYIYINFKLLD